ncbi:DUF6502 family protein [Marinobacter caseinilyticus]|uniref:DUF6502 family protein n=1 Tax=Marinobacter caseinilyticus TaxID=2692195 RepID=UPI00140E13B9|nr:DUF6502 family protein [Marinobacter caseinilyticus]
MSNAHAQALQSALARILKPLARLLLRNGIAFGDFAELARRAYVEAALQDSGGKGKKTSDSRAAIMTGLTRKDVKRLREALAGEQPAPDSQLHSNRAARVVSGWVQDADYQDAKGQPGVLAFEGDHSFSALVRRYSGDMTPRAVLDELVRVGVVSDSGGLTLLKRAYVPTGDDAELLNIFGEDVADLISTIDHNLSAPSRHQSPLYQRTLTYSKIPVDVLEQWRAQAAAQSQALLEQLDQWLAPNDQDISGNTSTSDVVRTGVSIFYFEEPALATDVRETPL